MRFAWLRCMSVRAGRTPKGVAFYSVLMCWFIGTCNISPLVRVLGSTLSTLFAMAEVIKCTADYTQCLEKTVQYTTSFFYVMNTRPES